MNYNQTILSDKNTQKKYFLTSFPRANILNSPVLIPSSLNLAFPKPFSFFDVHYGLNESCVVAEPCYHMATPVSLSCNSSFTRMWDLIKLLWSENALLCIHF